MILEKRENHPGFFYSTSAGGAQAETGRGMPGSALVESDDYVLIHGNGLRPAGDEAAIRAIRAMPAWQANPKPIRLGLRPSGSGRTDFSPLESSIVTI